jgi:hypothetical protein
MAEDKKLTQEEINQKVQWYNDQIDSLKDLFVKWLEEDGHKVEVTGKTVTREEEIYDAYDANEYELLINDKLPIELVPVGISIIGAIGRVDLYGPVGREKMFYLNSGGPAIKTTLSYGNYSETATRSHYNEDVKKDGWYWRDGIYPADKVSQLSKNVLENMIENITWTQKL